MKQRSASLHTKVLHDNGNRLYNSHIVRWTLFSGEVVRTVNKMKGRWIRFSFYQLLLLFRFRLCHRSEALCHWFRFKPCQ